MKKHPVQFFPILSLCLTLLTVCALAAYYPLRFYLEEGDPDSLYTTYPVWEGNYASLPTSGIEAPTKEGHIFLGWSPDPGDKIMTPEGVDVYAQWEPLYYEVTYMDGSTTLGTQQVRHGAIASIVPTPSTVEGYTFDGWYTEPECLNLWDFSTDVLTGDLTLYAGWQKDTSDPIVVVFFLYESEVHAISAVNSEGFVINWPADPTRPGYIFKGWALEDGAQTMVSPATIFTDSTGLWAVWEEDSTGSGGGTPAPVMIHSHVTVNETVHGSVTPSITYAPINFPVTLTVTPHEGWKLGSLTVTDRNGRTIPVTMQKEGLWQFAMPFSDVTVDARFISDGINTAYQTCPKNHTCPIHPYRDLSTTEWYHDALHFGIDNGILIGYGDGIFRPGTDTSRAMLATALWRMHDRPVVNYLMLFEDVPAETWYTEAVRWVSAEKLMESVSSSAFAPDASLTRAEVASILYGYSRYTERVFLFDDSVKYTDCADAHKVSDDTGAAIKWALGTGIMEPVRGEDGALLIDPDAVVSRVELAVILKNYCTN